MIYRRIREMRSSEWFGKLSTAVFYTVMAYLVLFHPDPGFFRVSLPVLISSALMLLALVLYSLRFFQVVAESKETEEQKTTAIQ